MGVQLFETMRLSIIIPTLNEAGKIEGSVRAALRAGDEVIVADGGSADGTPEIAARAGAIVIGNVRGRSLQMNAGARQADGDVFLFLHADTSLPSGARELIERSLEDPETLGGGFAVRYICQGWLWRLLDFQVNLRSRIAVPWGDQGLFVRREFFHRSGCYKPWRLMEDVELAHRMRKHGRLEFIRVPVGVSARRFASGGFLKTALRNQFILAAYYVGMSPDRLSRFYVYGEPTDDLR